MGPQGLGQQDFHIAEDMKKLSACLSLQLHSVISSGPDDGWCECWPPRTQSAWQAPESCQVWLGSNQEASSSPEARTIKGKQGLSYVRYPAGVRSCFPWNELPFPSHQGSHSSSTSALAFEPGEKSRAHIEVLLWGKWRLKTVYIISCSAEIPGLQFHQFPKVIQMPSLLLCPQALAEHLAQDRHNYLINPWVSRARTCSLYIKIFQKPRRADLKVSVEGCAV